MCNVNTNVIFYIIFGFIAVKNIKNLYIYIYIWYSSPKYSFEVAIESWPEWDLNPRPLNSVQTL